ncbi:hypothetical protein Dimus_010169 [Dionaea muscipula]
MKPSICNYCCFPKHRHNEYSSSVPSAAAALQHQLDVQDKSRLIRSASTWIRSTKPEIKDKCANLLSRIGKGYRGRRSYTKKAAYFRYDPLSYALNFEDDDVSRLDEFPLRNFSARLPPSPTTIPNNKQVLFGVATAAEKVVLR